VCVCFFDNTPFQLHVKVRADQHGMLPWFHVGSYLVPASMPLRLENQNISCWPVSGHLLEKSCSLAKLAEVSAALVAVSALAVLSCEELDSKITQCICQHDLQVDAGKGSIGPQLQAVRSCHPVQSGITCHPARDLPNGFRLLPILSEEPVRWADVAHDGGCQA
jgi:hypothetical protein